MKLFKEIFKALKYLWKIIASIGGTIKKTGEKIIRQLNRGIQKMLREITRGAKKVIRGVEKGGQKAIREITNGGKKVIRKMGKAVTGVVNEIGGTGRRIANDIARSGERIFNDIKRKVNEAIRRIGRFVTDAINKIKEVFDRAWRAIYDQAMRLKRAAEAAARAAAEAARAAAEAAKRAAEEAARKAAEAAKAVRNFFCFSGNTPIKLIDGKTVLLKHIKLEDTLINGTIVQATMQIKSSKEDPFYKIYSEELGEDVFVTGSHHIKWSDKYIPVREFEKAEKLDTVDDVLYCLVTSDHTIPVGEFTFWDWEDNLIPKA